MATSAVATKTTSPPATSHTITPTTPPISLLQTDAARRYTHVHAPLLFGFYVFRFNALVADPVSTMLNDLPYVALLQLTFCLLCLPPAGTAVAPGSGEKGAGGNTKVSGESLRRKLPGATGAGKSTKDQDGSFSNKIAVCFSKTFGL